MTDGSAEMGYRTADGVIVLVLFAEGSPRVVERIFGLFFTYEGAEDWARYNVPSGRWYDVVQMTGVDTSDG